MSKITNDLNWKIGGEAGFGILNAGLMFARAVSRSGLWAFANSEYPSLIRGGHNTLDVRVGEEKLPAHMNEITVLIALNKDTVDFHHEKVQENGGIVFDPEDVEAPSVRADIKLYPVPLNQIAKDAGSKILRNVIAMAVSMRVLDFDIDVFKQVIKDNFGKKGDAVVDMNIKAIDMAVKYFEDNFEDDFAYNIQGKDDTRRMLIDGNEAIAAGAIQAGCKFISAYPMTPASSIMQIFASNEKTHNLVIKHVEDEIAAMNTAIGANFAGVRAMTATSGGGFCLMNEALGLAAVTETPLVAVNASRPGPGTGMATHTGQADLRMLLHAGTDETPRVLIGLGDRKDAFYLSHEAFNIADVWQIPVILLTDKYLASAVVTEDDFDTKDLKIERGKSIVPDSELKEDYLRYRFTDDNISPRAIPGQPNGMHVASSYEHDEAGSECEDEDNRIKMHHKRFNKFEALKKSLPEPVLDGDKDADLTIISWGSTKGPVEEAMKRLGKDGVKTNHLHVVYLSPLHDEAIAKVINDSKKVVIIEGNYTGMLQSLIKEHTGLSIEHHIRRFDGRPFCPTQLTKELGELAK